jgi:hypothetical protein
MALNPLSEPVCRPRPDGARLVPSKGLLGDGVRDDLDSWQPEIELGRVVGRNADDVPLPLK